MSTRTIEFALTWLALLLGAAGAAAVEVPAGLSIEHDEAEIVLGVEGDVRLSRAPGGLLRVDGDLDLNGTRLLGALEALLGEVAALKNETAAARERVQRLEEEAAANSTAVAARIGVLEERLDALEARADAADAGVEVLQTNVTDVSGRLDTLEARADATDAGVADLQANATETSGRLDAAEDTLVVASALLSGSDPLVRTVCAAGCDFSELDAAWAHVFATFAAGRVVIEVSTGTYTAETLSAGRDPEQGARQQTSLNVLVTCLEGETCVVRTNSSDHGVHVAGPNTVEFQRVQFECHAADCEASTTHGVFVQSGASVFLTDCDVEGYSVGVEVSRRGLARLHDSRLFSILGNAVAVNALSVAALTGTCTVAGASGTPGFALSAHFTSVVSLSSGSFDFSGFTKSARVAFGGTVIGESSSGINIAPECSEAESNVEVSGATC